MMIVGPDDKVLVEETMGNIVKRWLAKHNMVAVERSLMEILAHGNQDFVVYHPESDTYGRKTR